MKRFQSILCATLLTLAMSSATFAGNIYGRSGTIYGGASIGTIYGIADLTDELTADAIEIGIALIP